MPFDSMPVTDRPIRLVALDPTLRRFGPTSESCDCAGFRPIPAWHSGRDPEHVGATIGVLARARELIADERRWCRRSFARGWGGIPVPAKSTHAQRLCTLGGVRVSAHAVGMQALEART